MKIISKLLLALGILLVSIQGMSQQVSINEDGALPNPNAILDIKSNRMGLLIPRMSTENRNAIPNTRGLLVYDTTTNSFWFNTGAKWKPIGSGSLGSGWLLTGNSGTDDSSFLGTTDESPLRFRVQNKHAGLITSYEGNTFFGLHSGTATLNPANYSNLNTGVGSYSLYNNANGFYNTAIGSYALTLNTSGHENTAVGMNSLSLNKTGKQNTAAGSNALHTNSTGGYNTAMGSHALASNTTGNYNAALGMQALAHNTSGYANTAIGGFALRMNQTGGRNTAAGFNALYSNDGTSNVAIGMEAMKVNSTGNYNTAIGTYAYTIGAGGDYNVALGYFSLQGPSTGSANTTLGAASDVLNSSGTINSTAIGFSAYANASNKIRLGNAAITKIEGQVPFSTPSDGRYKSAVKEDVKGLDFIMNLRPVTYQFEVEKFDRAMRGDKNDSISFAARTLLKSAYSDAGKIRRSGFIAQEVEKAAREAGYSFSGLITPTDEKDHYSISYESFVVPIIKAIQEQQQMIDELLDHTRKQREEITRLQNLLSGNATTVTAGVE